MRSASVAGFNRLNIRRDEHTIAGHVAGVVLLKMLIGVSHVDTNATALFIRGELCSLELCLPTIGHDVEKLNQHVRHLMERLSSRGETTYNLLSFPFKACAVVPDAKFRDHIEMKRSECEEGRVTQDGQPFTSECLMLLGDNKCKGMKQNKTWIVPSAADQKIVALQAEVTKLKQDISSKPPPLKPPPKDAKKGLAEKPAWMTKEPTLVRQPLSPTKARNTGGAPNTMVGDVTSPRTAKERGFSRAPPSLRELVSRNLPTRCLPLRRTSSTRTREFLAASGVLSPTRIVGSAPQPASSVFSCLRF
jgi:hypothetical protein